MSSSSRSSVPSLPPELILHILHLAYPSDAEDDYTGRSHDVLQCCLVSKQWKELVEPVLWRSVTITKSSQVDKLAQQPVEKRSVTRNLAFVEFKTSPYLMPEHIRQALRFFPDVEHIRFAYFVWDTHEISQEPLKLSDFEVLPNLHSLSFAGHNQAVADNAVLPNLELLGMPSSLGPDCLTRLNPNTTPSLRVLATDYVNLHSDPQPLLDLLDIIELNVGSSYSSYAVFRNSFRNVLFTIEDCDLKHYVIRDCLAPNIPLPPRHLRLKYTASWPALDNIFLLPHRPESLFLPLSTSSSDTAAEANDVAREAFLKRCKDEGVEVRWYRPAKEEWREVGCREFREYVEERKRRTEERT
ncbi:hypothetical protein JCM8097_006616 [Rhodosporidiobolus ruineniae]